MFSCILSFFSSLCEIDLLGGVHLLALCLLLNLFAELFLVLENTLCYLLSSNVVEGIVYAYLVKNAKLAWNFKLIDFVKFLQWLVFLSVDDSDYLLYI